MALTVGGLLSQGAKGEETCETNLLELTHTVPETNSKRAPFRVALRTVLISPFVALVVFAVGLTGYLSYRNGQQAVNDVSHQLRREITARIEEHLVSFLDTPHHINRINTDALRYGLMDAHDSDALEHHFWRQLQIFGSVTSIYFGNTAGGLVDAGREGPGGTQYVIATDHFAKGTFSKFAANSRGERTELLATVPDFDARTRPWYATAVQKGAATWSEIYVLFTGQDMAIAASQPVYDEERKLLGVVSVDLFLSHLDTFLKHLRIGRTGQAFIMDRSGMLVATSTDERPFSESKEGGNRQRLYAGESNVPLIRFAARKIAGQFGDGHPVDEAQLLEFSIHGERNFLQVCPVKDPYGLDWLVAVVIPEADFMARIDANNRMTILLIAAALALAVLSGIIAARKISRPIMHLNASARDLARGRWTQPVQDPGRICEISSLTQSFNLMTGQLQQMVESLTTEIEGRKQTEAALRQSEERLDLVLQGADLGSWDWNVATGDVVFNERWAEMLGYTLAEVRPHVSTWERLLHPDDVATITAELNDHLEGRTPIYQTEHRLLTKSGDWKWILDTGKVFVRDEAGKPLRALGTHQDITERKNSEEQARKALMEKEVLLREIHHRVKNNLAVISSLLSLQAKKQPDLNVQKAIFESQSRVRAMALIHETLYQADDLSAVNFEQYVRKLVRDLLSLYDHISGRISVEFDVQQINLEIGQAVSCGLIINELVTNSLKYAFPGERVGVIRISARKTKADSVELRVNDNGVGLPPGLDWKNPETLGLRLIALMVDQLHGTCDIQSGNGLDAVIRWVRGNPPRS